MLFLISLFFSSLAVAANAACFDNGDVEVKGNCYKFVNQRLTYTDAKNWCHYQNPVTSSYLAKVPDATTASHLAVYARSAFGSNDGNFWIGLSRSSRNSAWLWDNGDSLVFSNFGSSSLADNYVYESIVNAKWGTGGANVQLPFVCGYNPAAPPTFAPPASTIAPTPTPAGTTTGASSYTTTTAEDYDDNCNIGEKHSTFLLAYAADFDLFTFQSIKPIIIAAINNNRHNYTKLAAVRFDTQTPENITYYDDVNSFSAALTANPPDNSKINLASIPTQLSKVIESFLGATGRPLESSMIIALCQKFGKAGQDLTNDDYDAITNNNVKIFPFITDASYSAQFLDQSRDYSLFSSLAANSNGHFIISKKGDVMLAPIRQVMDTAYIDSLAFTRNLGPAYTERQFNNLQMGSLTVPRRQNAQSVDYLITVSVEENDANPTGGFPFNITFVSTSGDVQNVILSSTLLHTNLFTGKVTLSKNVKYNVVAHFGAIAHDSSYLIRIWTESAVYHYGSFAAISDPMAYVPLTSVDAYNGTAIRIRLMNDCYTDYEGSIIITDCLGHVPSTYEATQTIPTQYIFADEGSFPHYPFAPFFCNPTPITSCVANAQNKYDIQFLAGEFTVTRSFQCRPGVGQDNQNCQNVDSNGNLYCDRKSVPYKRGPTGDLTDCLGNGHLEFDFDDTQSYICVCNPGYSGESCEKKA